jgi:hypothetical protein
MTIIINLTYSKHSDSVAEIMFHCTNNDWFIALFPIVDVEFDKMKKHYMGKDFYEIKAEYKGRIFEEAGKDV